MSVEHHNVIIFHGKKKKQTSKNIVCASIAYAGVTMNHWSELWELQPFLTVLCYWEPLVLWLGLMSFLVYFKVFLGARAFLMSYKSTYLGKIWRTGRRQCGVTNSGGAANAKVTQGCGYSHWVLQWASCINTAWDYDRAGTERRKTWIHPVALWFSQVFWNWSVFQILKEPWWRPAILVEKKEGIGFYSQ